jgi:phage terminase small subunit
MKTKNKKEVIMSRGGYRPGAGRKVGSKDSKPRKGSKNKKRVERTDQDKIQQMVDIGKRARYKTYQEFLIRVANVDKKQKPLSTAEKRLMVKIGAEIEKETKVDPEITANAAAENMTPLDYMLKVMNDPKAEKDRRDKMAIAAAPFIHPRKGEGSAKEDKADRAKKAGEGKFAPSKPPLKVVK